MSSLSTSSASLVVVVALCVLAGSSSSAFQNDFSSRCIASATCRHLPWSRPVSSRTVPLYVLDKLKEETKTTESTTATETSPEETTEKYGLEAGLFQSLRSENGGETAKSLLKKYGIAYFATSIPLAIISFAFFYVLVDNGVDVTSLLSKVGIQDSGVADKAGTAAIAYAAHKAASPIRFPPTVLLTPVVARLIGKEAEDVDEEED